MAGSDRFRIVALISFLGALLLFGYSSSAFACSCVWEGPFITVSKKSPLVVRGRVLRHNPPTPPYTVPTLDFLVQETLFGGMLDSGLRIQMGDGMHCRPEAAIFPPETEWVLAINGPGAKPGDGLALSHCGAYWLRVEGDQVEGEIDGPQGERRRIPLEELRQRLRYPAFRARLRGRVEQGERFQRPFGPGFEFRLEPAPDGWAVQVRERGRDDDLSRLTPPLHFAPNPREIAGWQFADPIYRCPDRPYAAEAGPENPRPIIFSPAVGRTIDGPGADSSVTPGDVEMVRRFGRVELTIEGHAFDPAAEGCPRLQWIEFSLEAEGGY
jgi:hypothetical protein